MIWIIFFFHFLAALVSAATAGALFSHYRASLNKTRAHLFFMLFFFFFIFFNLAIALALVFGLSNNVILAVGYLAAMAALYTGLAFLIYVPFAVLPIPWPIAELAKTILPWFVALVGFISLAANIFQFQEPFITGEGIVIWSQAAWPTFINMAMVDFTALVFLAVFIYGTVKAATLVTKLKSLLIGVGAGVLGIASPFFFYATTRLEAVIYLVAIVLGVTFVFISALLKEHEAPAAASI